MSGNTDPRVRAVARSIGDERREQGFGIINNPRRLAERALDGADAADRAAGIVRVRIDDETVERVVDALVIARIAHYNTQPWELRDAARAVLAALTEGKS